MSNFAIHRAIRKTAFPSFLNSKAPSPQKGERGLGGEGAFAGDTLGRIPNVWAKAALCGATCLLLLTTCRPAEILPTQACASQELANHPRSARIRAVMAKYVKAGLPGMSVLVRDSAGSLFTGGAGLADVGGLVPFEPCTPSKGASITKLHVATLAHLLAEEGKLNLDAPLAAYVSGDILKHIKSSDGHTVRHLMNHTTGIYDLITTSGFYLAVLNQPNRRWQPEDLLKFIYGINGYTLNNPYPAHYSSTNTLLLMMCIEAATGRPHVELLREKIWGPLGMANTYMQGREDIPATAAHGYYDLYHNGTIADVSQLDPGSGNGYNGIFSTTADLAKFMDALFINKTLVSPATLERMTHFIQEDTNYYVSEGAVQKYFGRKRTLGIGHTGRDLGYVANTFYYPSQKTLIIFFVNYGTNGDSGLKQTFLNFEEELAQAVLD